MVETMMDGRLIDWIIGLVGLEALLVLGWRLASGRGPSPVAFIGNLVAGAFLLLAVRGALTGAAPMLIALSLGAAGAAHLVDLAGRWNEGHPSPVAVASPINTTLSLRVTPSRIRPAPPAQNDEASHG